MTMRELVTTLVLCLLLLPGTLAQAHTTGTVCSKVNPCDNFGTCIDGTCYCTSHFNGSRCENPINGYKCDVTDLSSCGKYGLCIRGVCICNERWSGPKCNSYDVTKVCPTVEAGDVEFFPTCTLSTTLKNLSSCINADISYTEPGQPVEVCRGKMLNTLGCFGRVAEKCFGMLCDSVWWRDDMSSWLMHFFQVLTDTTSEEFQKLSSVVCAVESGGKFQRPNITFEIGAPVCDPSTIDILADLYFTTGDDLVSGMDLCSTLERFKMQIFNVTRDQCNWANISQVLKSGNLSDFSDNFTMFLRATHAMLPEWTIPACIDCQLSCLNGGSCLVSVDYEQYCQCQGGYTGYLCESPSGACTSSDDCENSGYCHDGQCICQPSFTGRRCETSDPTHICPIERLEAGDALFLPVCTLKETLTKAAECINYVVPITVANQSEAECQGKMQFAVTCFLQYVDGCSKSTCDSIWSFPEVLDWATTTLPSIHEMSSPFMTRLSSVVCASFKNGEFVPPEVLFEIGEPVCRSDLIDNLVRLYLSIATNATWNPQDLCRYADKLRMGIYNETVESCNWLNISQVLPPGMRNHSHMFSNALSIAQNYFLEWSVPGCTACSNLTCMNNGTCIVAANFMEYCICPSGFTGMRCEMSTDCRNLTCHNGGTCYRGADGMELCLCQSGYGGHTCDQIFGQTCGDFYCENDGICDDSSGFPFCACNPGFGGTHCEYIDDTHQCPSVSSEDSIFLPLCTLKTALSHMSECVNAHLPYMYPGGDMEQCRKNITRTVACWGVITLECSKSTCPSIWFLPGTKEYAESIFTTLYNMESNFMRALVPFLCADVGQDGMYHVPHNITFDLGFGICDSSLSEDVVRLMVVSANEVLMNQQLTAVCGSLDRLRSGIYEAFGTCDFNRITRHLPVSMRPFASQIISALKLTREYFQEWVIPICRGIDDGTFDVCPQVTEYSTSCQFAEAWTCEYKNFRRQLANWRMQFKDWWMTCTNFHMRDWRNWVGVSGAMHGRQWGADWGMDMIGWAGFEKIWKESFACPEWNDVRCAGGRQANTWMDGMGCGFPVCPGANYANPRILMVRYQNERQYYSKLMMMYKNLVSECSSGSSFASCGIGDAGGSGGGDFSTTTSWGGSAFTTGVTPTMHHGSPATPTAGHHGGNGSPPSGMPPMSSSPPPK